MTCVPKSFKITEIIFMPVVDHYIEGSSIDN